jgi:hypothetical protein
MELNTIASPGMTVYSELPQKSDFIEYPDNDRMSPEWMHMPVGRYG